ncbi:MAG: hypothetical protein ACI39E_02020 [Acutalibacteraceae bacterium]
MKTKTVYRYDGDNGVIITAVALPMVRTELVRLIADDGMVLVNGDKTATVMDVLPDEAGNWTEIPAPSDDADEENENL